MVEWPSLGWASGWGRAVGSAVMSGLHYGRSDRRHNCHIGGIVSDVTDDVLPSRRERRAVETRAAIVEAARSLFEEQGFADTTVDEIAGRADIAPRTFFRYFE